MPAPTNLSFETAGAQPGEAASWVAAFTSTYDELAGFGTGNSPIEGFEDQWANDPYLFAFAGPDLARAVFADPVFPNVRNADDFEVLWFSNEGFTYDLAATVAALFDTQTIEDFEDQWDNDIYLLAFAGADTVAGTPDTFETGWQNVPYLTSLTPGDLSAAVFDGPAPEAFEDFDEVFPLRDFEVNPTTDVLTSIGHGFVLDQAITLTGEGTLPEPLRLLLTYYARSVAANTLQLSTSPGGSAIDITNSGVGQRQLRADEDRYWTLQMTSL